MELKIFVLLAMIFCHIVDDYNLQGWLASAKQKSWWKETAPDPMYQYDYIMALVMHSISWSFMVMLPAAVYLIYNGCSLVMMFFFFVMNAFLHADIDDMKANKKGINLIQDQTLHLAQILLSWVFVVALC